MGSLVGQIAKIHGLKVIGIAGTDDKCRWLVDELGFDKVINYKKQNVAAALKEAAPSGVDCYFDNVSNNFFDRKNYFKKLSFFYLDIFFL